MLKRAAERALSSRLVGRFTRQRVRGKRLILAYHGIVPHGGAPAGERALFVSQQRFCEHLDALAELADVAPLAEIDAPGDGRPRVAITFDDAYQGAVSCAVDELAARQFPATIFVSPGRMDGHVFWWDALAHDSGELDPAVRHHALDVLAGSDERVRAWAAEAGLAVSDDLPSFARSATGSDIARAAARPGITIGSHTWSHANLTRLSGDALVAELERPLVWLRERFSAWVPWLAYPYGSESADVHRAAAVTGYHAALCISGGWHRAENVSPFARPRLNVSSGLSVDGLRARLVGAIR